MARTFRPAAVLLPAFALWLAATASANPAPTSPATALAIEVREDSAALDAALAAKDAPAARTAAAERLGALRRRLLCFSTMHGPTLHAQWSATRSRPA
jgi:hypothetical protein